MLAFLVSSFTQLCCCFKFHAAMLLFQVSGFRFHAAVLLFQVSSFMFQVPSFRFHIAGL